MPSGASASVTPAAVAGHGPIMRRVLIITPLFPPDAQVGAKRPLRFVRHLRDQGWEPLVFCLPAPLPMNADVDLADAVPEGVEIFREYAGGLAWRAWRIVQGLGENALGRGMENAGGRWAPARADSAGSYRLLKDVERVGWSVLPLDQFAPWVPRAAAVARRIARPRRVDAVLAIGDPFSAFVVGAALRRMMGLPLVLDLRDPWTLDPAWFSKKVEPLHRMEALLERSLFETADRLVLNTSESHRAYQRLYPALASKMDCIPNGFDRSLFRPAPDIARNGPFTLLHFGNVFGGRSVLPILRAVRRLVDRGELAATDFRLVIRGELDVNDASAAESLGLSRCLEVRAYRPYRDAMIELKSADVLVVLEAKNLTLQIPAKLYDYLCAERPILSVGQPGEASDLVERLGVGAHFMPTDEEGIAAALTRWRGERHAPSYGRRERHALGLRLDEFDAPRQTAQLAATLDSAVAAAVAR